jgi:hypothetical protein
MAATTLDRNTKVRFFEREVVLPLKANAVIPLGVLVCTDATGAAVNGSDTAGLTIQGWSAQSVDQTKGDTKITVNRGVANFDNDGTIVQASIGSLATILDNHTLSLAATTANDIGAGYIEEIDSDGVWISILGGKPAAA